MTRSFAYDAAHEPPAPVIPVHVAAPLRERATLLRAVIDTGADCTVVPERVVRDLALPRIDRVEIAGVTGSARLAPVQLPNRLRLDLDGPSQRVHLLRGRRSRVRR